MENNVIIRSVTPDDAEELLKIYSYYVENTAITYEYTVPTVDEFRSRIQNTLKRYPYIAAECNGKLLGYAYTGAFHPRAAYAWAVETSIYLDKDAHGLGLGRRLYDALETASHNQNILDMYACIAVPEHDDEYLTHNSVQFHEHLGFKTVGYFQNCAYKFGRWYGMVWMHKSIGEHTSTPSAVVPLGEAGRN